MEKYVVSRELAEKLKDSGYPQNTEWFLRIHKPTGATKLVWHGDMEYDNDRFRGPQHAQFREENDFFAVPLTDELLEQLSIHLGDNIHIMRSPEHGSFVSCKHIGGASQLTQDKTADALAELWLWCKEKGYIGTANE